MVEIRDSIVRWPTAQLVPFARNSRTHSDEQIGQIVRRWQEYTGAEATLESSGATWNEVVSEREGATV